MWEERRTATLVKETEARRTSVSMRTTDTFRSVTVNTQHPPASSLVWSDHSSPVCWQVGSVAWGVGCGNQIPSVYSKTAGSMCWIDWVMSCVSVADFNIDIDSGDFLGELRDADDGTFKSAGGLTEEQCRSWLDSQPTLKKECDIVYEIIDNRSTS